MTPKALDNTHKRNLRLATTFSMLIGMGLVGVSVTADDGRGKKMFDRVDTNGDGVVSFDEFRTPKKSRLRKADTDGDGQLTRSEVTAHAQQRGDEMIQRANERFSNMDLNGDDIVTSEEAREAAFYRLDKDQDGYLSPEELKRPQRMKGPRAGNHHEQSNS